MKKIYLVVAAAFIIFQTTYAQSFEIRLVNKGSGEIGIQLRETSGTNTPTSSDFVTDTKFGIKWLASYGVDLTSSITTSYFITKSDIRKLKGSYHFQAFYANNTPFQIPSSWTTNTWVEIMSITNNLAGSGSGTFEICETGFDVTTDLNFGINFNDYTPAINGSATGVPLPVELTSFTVKSVSDKAVNLSWQTKTEVDNYGFEVERASSSTSPIQGWEKIGFMPGYGNSNSPKDYSFVDKNPTGGSKFIYRLKQLDNTGTFEYSDQVEIELLPDNFTLYQNYPNPFNPETNIKFAVPKAGNITLSVYNILGEKVRDLVTGFMEAGIYEISFDGKDLTNGTYIYRLQADDFTQVKKMLLMK